MNFEQIFLSMFFLLFVGLFFSVMLFLAHIDGLNAIYLYTYSSRDMDGVEAVRGFITCAVDELRNI